MYNIIIIVDMCASVLIEKVIVHLRIYYSVILDRMDQLLFACLVRRMFPLLAV